MKKGDSVAWKSQSGGLLTEKSGIVIAEIPAGQSARKYIPATAKKSHIKFDDISSHDRMMVAVQAGVNGQIIHYYCPRKSVLISQGNE